MAVTGTLKRTLSITVDGKKSVLAEVSVDVADPSLRTVLKHLEGCKQALKQIIAAAQVMMPPMERPKVAVELR